MYYCANKQSSSWLILMMMLVSAAFVAQPREARAQAWVAPPNSFNASLSYQFSRSSGIVETPSLIISGEPVIGHSVILGAEYVPLDRLSVGVALPFMMVKYAGDGTLFPRHGRYDDGDFHGTLQDLRLQARYQVLREVVALSPHIAGTIPVRDYETVGYAHVGRGLMQLHLGASIGRTLDPYVPNLYLHGQYEFTLSQRYDETEETREVGQNRSDAAVQVGYFLLGGKLEMNLGANFRFAHGGIHFIDWQMLSPDLQMYHDPLLHEEYILVGGGASYSLTDTLHLSAAVRLFVRGENTTNAHSVTVGASWDIL
jgi:hypothetical protein